MKKELWLEALDEISDRHIAEAAQSRRKLRRRKLWTAAAALLAVAILAGALLRPGVLTGKAYAVSLAEYPEAAPSSEGPSAVRQAENAQQLGVFSDTVLPLLLSGGEGENRLCSPLNVYLSLSMLTELTGGASRRQLLNALGAENLETVRARASALWQTHYRPSGQEGMCILANSLWMDESISYHQDTLDTLSKAYYASSYQGTMGSPNYDRMLRQWVDQQTGGLLADQAKELQMSDSTHLALVSAICYESIWTEAFEEEKTASGTFYAPSGPLTCEFMHAVRYLSYYETENFTAVALQLQGSEKMWFLLPREGVLVETLLADPQSLALMRNGLPEENGKLREVKLTIPKFDISSKADLLEVMEQLGVTQVLSSADADFSPLSSNQVGLTEASHTARMTIDEAGCAAAACTDIRLEWSAYDPSRQVDFTLDRPFLFSITDAGGIAVFAGVVNQP